MARHMSSVHHNWSLLKSDRFSLQNTLPVSIMVGPLTLEVDRAQGAVQSSLVARLLNTCALTKEHPFISTRSAKLGLACESL